MSLRVTATTALTPALTPMNGHQHRAAPSGPTLTDKAKATGYLRDFDQLTRPAFTRLVTNLEGFGNVLNEKHRRALMCILGRFTMLANGTTSGRYAFDLPCGGGKTQAIIAWSAALIEAGLPYSVAVCSSKVEALCDIKRHLIKNGVPAEKIGLLHSYEFDEEKAEAARLGEPEGDGFASLPRTDGNDGRQILLITHARLRGGADIGEYMEYRGAQRSIVLYDESLFHSEHRAIESVSIEQGIGYIRPLARTRKASSDLGAALDYLDKCIAVLTEELDKQRADPDYKARTISLPSCEPDALQRMINAVPGDGPSAPVRQLLKIAHADLRVVDSNQGGGGFVQYDIVVPRELENIAVLDASYAIRDLVKKYDSTVQLDPRFDGDIADYSNVTIHQLRAAAGRGSMTEDFSQQRAANRKVSSEIVEVVKSIPEDEGVLLFTFKPRGRLNMASKMKIDLKAAGIDINARVSIEERQKDGTVKLVKKPRFQWLTWGQETCTSEHVYSRNVLFAGVLHRADLDLAAAIVAQRDDLLLDVSDKDIRGVCTSEIVHCLYQAMARGSLRVIKDGVAQPMNAWIIYPSDNIRPDLDTVLPGVVWKEWDAKHLLVAPQKVITAAREIIKFLLALPDDVTKLSTQRLKKGLALPDLSSQSLRRARDAACEQLADWNFEGRCFVRKASV